jgi:hypothetical protein
MRTTVDEPASRPNSSRADTSIITAKIPQILRFGLEKLAHAMREQSNRNRYDVDHNSRSCTIYWRPSGRFGAASSSAHNLGATHAEAMTDVITGNEAR